MSPVLRCSRCTLALAVVVAALSGTALAQGAPPAPPVTVASPLAKRITTWDEYSGRFKSIEMVDVRPRVSGFIESIHFKDGAIVKAGDQLFTLDKSSFQLAVESAKADVARYEAQVQVTQTDVDRAEPLAKTRVLTEKEFEQRKANLAVAQAQLLAALTNVKVAELNLEWTEVRAPIAGRISDRKVDAGNTVVASQTPLTTIISLDPIYFEFEVSEIDYLRYRRSSMSGARPSSRDVANPVRVRLADEQAWTHDGKMDFVDNAMSQGSGTMRGRAVLENKDQLFSPGLFGRIQLFGGDIDALLLPDSAIVSDQARKIVFTVNADNTIVPATVELGATNDGLRIIKSGLAKDARVVIDGIANPMVRPGAKVAPQDGEIKTTASN